MKVLKKQRLWAGLCAVMGFVFLISIFGGSIAMANSGNINNALNAQTSIIVKDENAEDKLSIYHETTIGDGTFTQENRSKIWEEAYKQNYNEMAEGAALLKNDDALPLKEGAHITLMGHATVQPLYDCMAAGTRTMYAPNHLVEYVSAFKSAGFVVNDAMVTALKNGSAKRGVQNGWSVNANGSAKGVEENKAFYEAQRSTYATDYKDAAILMFAREGAEGQDILMDDDDDVGGSTEKISGLALHKNERDLLELARADFDKVIVLLNSPYQIEAGEINKLADAVLYVGAAGHRGFQAVAEILKGAVNPSGHIVDTYAVNSLSAPAVVNSGTRTPEFANLDEIYDKLGDKAGMPSYSSSENVELASVQAENIYIGYRYYETRYADTVYGNRGANSVKGSSTGKAWNYADEVTYPFGSGLSYTTFKQEITDFNNGADSVEVTVKVTNTGKVAGKAGIQLYAQTPYDDYEIKHKVEKSAVELVGYGKTKMLEPNGGEDTVKITVDKYLLASYDSDGVQGYYLSSGQHYFAIGDNAHDALNNILAAQNYSAGMDGKGDKNKVRSYNESFDSNRYGKGENGVVVTNRFEDRDLNYWQKDAVTYLSRSNWDATYPTKQTVVTANDKMIEVLSGKWYKTEDKESPYYDWSSEARNSKVTYAEVAGKFQNKSADGITITIPMMRDVEYIGDSIWDDFVYQIALDELYAGTGENLTSSNVGSISPGFVNGDGCDSSMMMTGFYTFDYATGEKTKANDGMSLRYCSKNILVGTFNDELIANRGRMMGEEGLWGQQMMISGGGYDLHRTPFGGRNFEYMSECPTLTYLASIPETIAMEKTGVHMAPKHFASNDQETQREGVTVFMTEQALREGSLRAFEGSLRVAKAGGLMASFERIGMIWASADYALNTEVLRGEWGFNGFIVTDASKNDENIFNNKGYFNHAVEGFVAGTTNWCFDTNGDHGKYAVQVAKETDDGYLLLKVIEATKYWLKGVATSSVINGISATDKIIPVTPAWQIALKTIQITSGVLFGLLAAMAIASAVLCLLSKNKEKREA